VGWRVPGELFYMILTLAITAALVPISILISLGRALEAVASKAILKLVGGDVEAPPEVERSAKLKERLFTAAWIAAGAAGVYMVFRGLEASYEGLGLRGYLLLASALASSIGVFLAFKTGAELSSRIVFAFHDARIMRERGGGGGILYKALAIPLIANTLLLAAWGVATRGLKAYLGAASGPWLTLWILGLAFGGVYGFWRASGEPRLLMRDTLAVALYLGAVKAREKLPRPRLRFMLPRPGRPG
jgi:hypothetical protein